MGSFTKILYNFNISKKNLTQAISNSKWERTYRENILSSLVSLDLAKILCISEHDNRVQLSDDVYTDESRFIYTDLDTGIISLRISVFEHNANGEEKEISHVLVSDPKLIVRSCNQLFCKKNNSRVRK